MFDKVSRVEVKQKVRNGYRSSQIYSVFRRKSKCSRSTLVMETLFLAVLQLDYYKDRIYTCIKTEKVTYPNIEHKSIYDFYYINYRGLYKKTKELEHQLSQMFIYIE